MHDRDEVAGVSADCAVMNEAAARPAMRHERVHHAAAVFVDAPACIHPSRAPAVVAIRLDCESGE